ncbi:hypothetical protein PRZ48_005657 [Zasmidium cellare]|uniref:F-box domain-containing protein n=1 Tax=Zasmidium cellare TaxID=395010 RepID=A0ABR0EKZ2_ZASCE|nr:hypothetical protein PRZ48_005657 [Zasmidium cellare]
MATNDQRPLLNLPKELLFQIANFASDFDILNLRLAHRRLYEASSDRFAESYLSSVNCSFLDPAGLLRAHQITGRPHLAHKIKRLKITVDIFETRDIRQFARSDREDYFNTDYAGYHPRQFTASKDTHTTRTSINWLLAKCILENIKHIPGCQLFLKPNIDTLEESVGQYGNHFVENFLALSLRVGRLVDAIEITEQSSLNAAKYRKGGALWPALQNLVSLEHSSQIPDPQGPPWKVYKAHIKAFGTICNEAPKLHTVHRGQRIVSPDEVFTGCIEHDKCDQREHVSDPEDRDFKWHSVTHPFSVGRPVLEYYLGNGFTLLRWLYEGELEDMLEEGLEEDLDEGSDNDLEQDSEEVDSEEDSAEDVEEDEEEDSDENLEVD